MSSRAQLDLKLRALQGCGIHVDSMDGMIVDGTGRLPVTRTVQGGALGKTKERATFREDELHRLLRLHVAAMQQNVQAERAAEALANLDPKHTQSSYTAKWQRTKKADRTADLQFDQPFPGITHRSPCHPLGLHEADSQVDSPLASTQHETRTQFCTAGARDGK
ncbi:hypothetical protein AYL99_05188 [Fonsecaea erecta]|uniref:Uncharacterized protein n=1 Tax=Fonsecaea erecta TaxID=1367422 RepID=A0A178ZL99_9EURO|nr:hypothetical protein AYL99_05188 [Fonsecaea erecta]OAP60186.1 hypothetical protein AYL99_05188 [Fonsecaea erecta]